MSETVTDEMVMAAFEKTKLDIRIIYCVVEAALSAQVPREVKIAELEERLKNAETSRTYWWHRCRDLEAAGKPAA